MNELGHQWGLPKCWGSSVLMPMDMVFSVESLGERL